jgi:hypothetical protein
VRGGPSVWARRLEVCAATTTPADLRATAASIAAEFGLSPEEILAEAGALAGRCRAAGATTPRAMAALVAAEHGLDAEELWAEAGRVAAAHEGVGR